MNEEISLEIRHSITDWRKLTPIRVGLYAVSYPDCFVAPGMWSVRACLIATTICIRMSNCVCIRLFCVVRVVFAYAYTCRHLTFVCDWCLWLFLISMPDSDEAKRVQHPNVELELMFTHIWLSIYVVCVHTYANMCMPTDGYLPHLDDPLPEHEPQPDQLADLSPTENERSHVISFLSISNRFSQVDPQSASYHPQLWVNNFESDPRTFSAFIA